MTSGKLDFDRPVNLGVLLPSELREELHTGPNERNRKRNAVKPMGGKFSHWLSTKTEYHVSYFREATGFAPSDKAEAVCDKRFREVERRLVVVRAVDLEVEPSGDSVRRGVGSASSSVSMLHVHSTFVHDGITSRDVTIYARQKLC